MQTLRNNTHTFIFVGSIYRDGLVKFALFEELVEMYKRIKKKNNIMSKKSD